MPSSPGAYTTTAGVFSGELDQVTAEKVPRWLDKTTFTCKGYKQLTIVSTVGGTALSAVTSGIPSGSLFALVQFDGPIHWRDDGTAPTAALGMQARAGDEKLFDTNPLSDVKFIGDSGTVTANITFYG